MEGETPTSFAEYEPTCSTTVPQEGAEVTASTEPPVARVNPQALDVIKEKVYYWKKTKRLCCIIFDKIKLQSRDYTKKKKYISKYIQLSKQTSDSADHVLTILLNCVAYNDEWRQAIAYYFTKSADEGSQMKSIMKAVVAAVCGTGLQPVALVSNQDTAFQYAFRSLQKHTTTATGSTDGTIHLNGQCLSVIYDPLHLLRGIRNHFVTKNIEFDGRTSRWQDLVDVYGFDRKVCGTSRLLWRLDDNDVIPEKIKNNKAENCKYLFSKRVAGLINFILQFGFVGTEIEKSPTLANTSELVAFLDDLYDSVSMTRQLARQRDNKKKLRRRVTKQSEHDTFWMEAIEKIEHIKFIDQHGNETAAISKRTFKNLITTVKSFQRLLQVLQLHNKNIECIYTGDFNLPEKDKWKCSRVNKTLMCVA